LRVLVLTFVAIGAIFGAIDVATIAFAREHDASGFAGLLLAIFALSGGLAGVTYGARVWGAPAVDRLQVVTALMCPCVLSLALVDRIALAVPAMALAGLTMTPSIITGFSLASALVPREALTEGFTWLSASLMAGVALGLAIGGHVAERSGGHDAYRVAVAAAAAAALVATAGRTVLAHAGEPA
jgi:hypothetical protein